MRGCELSSKVKILYVFGVKESLILDFEDHDDARCAAELGGGNPFATAIMDFVLVPTHEGVFTCLPPATWLTAQRSWIWNDSVTGASSVTNTAEI